MTEISKCKSCGYVGPWKACCGRMNLDAATADEAWQASRKQALEEAAQCSECYDLGTPEGHDIARHIRTLATPEGEQG